MKTSTHTRARLTVVALLALVLPLHAALPTFNFADPAQAGQWGEPHDLAGRAGTVDGLMLTIRGADPWIIGPPRDFPTEQTLWLHLRLKSESSGNCQVFYFSADKGATESNSVRFAVRGGDWTEAKVRLPALGPRHRFRIDPPGDHGAVTLQRLWFTERLRIESPVWPKPEPPTLGDQPLTLESGGLKLRHNRSQVGGFTLEVDGMSMAAGHTTPMIGYLRQGRPRWFPVNAPGTTVVVHQTDFMPLGDATVGGSLTARATLTDPDGAKWTFEHLFKLSTAGSLQVEATARCDQDRDVLYLPLFTLLPGLGSYGTNKTQALFAGVEYLDNEPSSSTADLNPPEAYRQVPDTAKLTLPLMVVTAQERYLALAWNQPPTSPICAFFDSPDRSFGSGAHVMGLLFPGSDGLNREESSLLPYDTARLMANNPVSVAGLLMAGRGRSVVPAVQNFVQRFGLPARPISAGGTHAYLELAARGWLDSQIRDGDRYRHAAPGFGSQPAADAAVYEDWLAARLAGHDLAPRLTAAAQATLAQLQPGRYNQSQVGHVRSPLPALVYGSVEANLDLAEQVARGHLARFTAAGVIPYRSRPGELDYGKTHWATDANGLTAASLATALREAAFAGSRELIEAGLRHLRALTERFHDTVPRGAQTWEIALHTPDILASAHLVDAYVLGYELSGDTSFLEQAKYWAWTGVPFVYLTAPTDQAIGLYATIPVLGATQWIAPNWMGLPVQWCGLVYAEAIQRLARHDNDGPWFRLAEGIVYSGIQQTYPSDDPANQGLLPDSFGIRTQTRNPANINPATLLAPAVRALRLPAAYDFRSLRRQGVRIHAPAEIQELEERSEGFSFRVDPWSCRPGFVLINGLREKPNVRLNDEPVDLSGVHTYQATAGRLILQVAKPTHVQVTHSATTASPSESERKR